MKDARVEALADVLVHHSVKLQRGEKALIIGSSETAPLIKEVYRSVLRAGGHPMLQVGLPELDKIYYDEASDEQLADI